MKNKLFWLILVLTVLAILFSIIKGPEEGSKEFKPLEMNVGDTFDYLEYPNTMYVLNYMIQDITGDGTTDMVMAIGEKERVDALLAENMDLVVYEPNGDRFYQLKLKNMKGEMPKLQTCELTGDTLPEVVLMANGENDSLQVRIGSFQNGVWQEIFKAKDNKGIVFQGEFLDGFKAHLKNTKLAKDVTIDVKDRKENYVTSGFYDESGRLLQKDAKITTTPFTSWEFVELNDYYGIQTRQRIIGFNAEDLLDELTVIWKYEDGKWQVKEAKGMGMGNLLY